MALPDGYLALGAGTALVLGGLSLVLWPLLNDGTPADLVPRPSAVKKGPADEASDGAVAALREIEFDRATGKLSDIDYAELKTRYTKAALAELRAADAMSNPPSAAVIDEPMPANISPVDAAIRRARMNQKSCMECGPRAEPDALYCSHCGRYLPGACGKCGTNVTMAASRFCAGCGDQLAAA